MLKSLLKRNLLFVFLFLSADFSSAQPGNSIAGKESSGSLNATQQEQLRTMFSGYSIYELNTSSIYQFVKSSGNKADVVLSIGSYNWTLELEPRELRSSNYKMRVATENGIVEYPRGEVFTYKGRIKDNNQSAVRLSILENLIAGYITNESGTVYIEPLNRFVEDAETNLFIVYKPEDVNLSRDMNCEAIDLHHAIEKSTQETKISSACETTDISIAADYSMVTFLGSVANCQQRFIEILNSVEGVYDSLGIAYTLQTFFISNCSSCDPWVTTGNNTLLLSDFTNWGNGGGFGNMNHDVASFWTRRALSADGGGAVVGTAYLNAICTSSGYGILQFFQNDLVYMTNLQAHELGHNWSSGHDASGAPYIMAPNASRNLLWSAYSKGAITGFKGTRTCLAPCASPPMSLFTISQQTACAGSSVTYLESSYNGTPDVWAWSFPGGTPDTSNDKNPIIQYNTAGTYSATLTVSNTFGSDSKSISNIVTVYPQVGATAAPFAESFEGFATFPENDWVVTNDAGSKWELNTTTAATGTKSVWLNNFSNSVNTKDVFITPGYDLRNLTGAKLNFKIAYAVRSASSTDKLNVYVSPNCGQTWSIRYTKSGNTLATAGLITTVFTPDATQWRQDQADLSSALYSGQPNISFKFEYTHGGGNNMYIDDINVTGIVGVNELEFTSGLLSIFPNPAVAGSILRVNLSQKEKVTIGVYDMLGKEIKPVASEILEAGEHIFHLGEIGSAGVYSVRMTTQDRVIASKVIVL